MCMSSPVTKTVYLHVETKYIGFTQVNQHCYGNNKYTRKVGIQVRLGMALITHLLQLVHMWDFGTFCRFYIIGLVVFLQNKYALNKKHCSRRLKGIPNIRSGIDTRNHYGMINISIKCILTFEKNEQSIILYCSTMNLDHDTASKRKCL